MTNMIKLTLPVSVIKHYKTKKDKNIYINLNNYRNWNPFLEHEVKETFQNIVIDKIGKQKINAPVYVMYILYVGDKRVKDTNNVTCIADKYVCDALVKWWYIEDDNYNFIKGTYSAFGGYDKGNARLEVSIFNSKKDLILGMKSL